MLQQGLRRAHVGAVVATCAALDLALMALGILENFDLASLPLDGVATQHLQIEAMKLAFADVYRYVADELFYLLGSLELKALFYDHSVAGEVDKIADKLPKLKLRVQTGSSPMDAVSAGAEPYEALLASGGRTLSAAGRSDNDQYLLCTGGTTGMPKGVVWPHKSLFMGALGGGGIYFQRPPIEKPEDLGALVASAPPLSFFAIAPMMHGAAQWGMCNMLFAGAGVALYTQLHHAAVDGQAAVALANALLDLSPVPRTLEIKPSRRQKVFKLDMTEMLRGVLGNQAQKLATNVSAGTGNSY